MSDVLGTALFATANNESTALLISDLHVPADGGQVLTRLRGAIAAARTLSARLYVLGDLFDSYVAPAQVRAGVWLEVATMFREAVTAGVAIDILHGNRDFMLGREFVAASGARVFAGGLRGPLAGVDTLLLHGDELCQNDLPYQRAKRWLRHAVTRWVARQLPLCVAQHVAERARKKSRKVIASGDQQRFLPTLPAVGAAFATGARRLVFGHIHRHCHGVLAAGEYWVLPAFDATGIGLLAENGAMGSVRFLDAAGRFETLAVPPACPLAP